MAQHQQLSVLGHVTAEQDRHGTQNTAGCTVRKRQEHQARIAARQPQASRAQVTGPIVFPSPTGLLPATPTPPPPPPPWTGLCPVTAGTWELPYDDGTTQQTATYTSAAAIGTPGTGLAIDHVDPKADAWNAGLWSVPSTTAGRLQISDFANDIEGPELWAVSWSTNSSKGDSRPDEWLPDNKDVVCTYVKAWITVKYEWNLSVLTTPNQGQLYSKKDVLQRTLNGCP